MTATYKERKWANEILAHLIQPERVNHYTDTISILKALGIQDHTGNRTAFRAVLDRLAQNGKILKLGGSKFKWRIKVTSWDSSNPFERVEGDEEVASGHSTGRQNHPLAVGGQAVAGVRPGSYHDRASRAGWFEIIGNTFPYKDRIKAAGGYWDGDRWSIPPQKLEFIKTMLATESTDTFSFRVIEGTPKPEQYEGMTMNPVSSNITAGGDSRIKNLEKQLADINAQRLQIVAEKEKLAAQVKDLEKQLAQRPDTIKIEKGGKVVHTLPATVLPTNFKQVLDLVEMRIPVFLFGPTGCGKTYTAKLVADTLKMKFGALPCTEGTSEINLLGRSMPDITKGDHKFQPSEFVDIYKGGGLFVFEEIDASNPNLLLCINTALANGYCPLPNGGPKMRSVEMHADFIAIATANTRGYGADRVYCGRNQLDEATLDRFRMGMVWCDYDAAVEKALCPDDDLRNRLQGIRKLALQHCPRRVVSTRFLEQAYKMKKGKNWSDKVIVAVLTESWSSQEKSKCGV